MSSTASAVLAPSRRRLAVFPVYRDNPYLNLLLLAPRAAGWKVLESARLEAFEKDVRSLGRGDVVHVHWTAPIVQRASTSEEGTERLRRFQVAVDDAQRRGATVLWTVHNALPHDVQHRALELELSRFLASTADVIHVMNSGTARVVEDDYSLPRAKLVHIPHPSYRGVYETGLSREEARASFDFAEDEFAVLFFGQVRPYKGVDLLIEAFHRTTSTGRFVFMLAGRTSPEDKAVIDGMLPEGLRCVRHHDFLADEEVERWFAAADLTVLPYRRILNSGTLHLAATYGVPVALPDEDHLRKEFGAEQWISWFSPGDVDDLAALLEQRPPSANGAAAFSDRLRPFSVSRTYAKVLARAAGS
ncbi:glycosyltransferase [Curtobacterium sp. 1P10AnD]|uniref:glycosyltransferase n=1 Tax=Curtobacterium sp. 1P10AnD TaxID=3132283 RepID=UPI0039A2FE10